MAEPTPEGMWMTDERLDELAQESPCTLAGRAELVRELRRLRSGATLLMRVDGWASQQFGYVGSPLAKETKHWLYD